MKLTKLFFLHSFHPIHNTSVNDVSIEKFQDGIFRWKHRLEICHNTKASSGTRRTLRGIQRLSCYWLMDVSIGEHVMIGEVPERIEAIGEDASDKSEGSSPSWK